MGYYVCKCIYVYTYVVKKISIYILLLRSVQVYLELTKGTTTTTSIGDDDLQQIACERRTLHVHATFIRSR